MPITARIKPKSSYLLTTLSKIFFILLVSTPAWAFYPSGEPEFFIWNPPTQRVDGSPLNAATDIQAYILRCEAVGQPKLEIVTAGGLNDRYNVALGTFLPGDWVCKAYASDTGGLESAGSNAVEILIQDYRFSVAPRPPSALGVG